MSKHTPTPWRIRSYGVIVKDTGGIGGFIIAEAVVDPDAIFIVQACNLHDEAVRLLEIVKVSIELGQKLPSGLVRTTFNQAEIAEIKAFLAKAKHDG